MVKPKKSKLSSLLNPDVINILGELAKERLQKLEELKKKEKAIAESRESETDSDEQYYAPSIISPKIKKKKKKKKQITKKKSKRVVVHQAEAALSDAREEESTVPEWLLNYMRLVNGSDPKKIIEKKLLKSDLCKKLYRLSIPVKQVVDKDFLSKEELSIIQKQGKKKRKKGIKAVLVDEDKKKWDVELRRWGLNSTSTYVLVNGWTQVLQDKDFVVDHQIRLWSFRSHDRLLHFALLPPNDAGQASSSLDDAGQGSSSTDDSE